jgi:type IV pilus assembly protein PilM
MKLGLNVTEDNKDKIVSIIMEDTDVIASEIQKSIEFYSTAANRNVEKIFLSGGSSKISGINQLLSEKLGVSVETLDPLKKVSVNKKIFDPEYIDYISPMIAIATGLAIRRFDDSD